MKLQFYLRFHTRYGQSIFISGNTDELGNNNPKNALQMKYLNNDFWYGVIDIKRKSVEKKITYHYFIRNEDGEFIYEWGRDRQIELFKKDLAEIHIADTWNHAGEYENAFFTAPFHEVLLKANSPKRQPGPPKDFTHLFRIKAPLLNKNEVVCLLGSPKNLANWDTTDPFIMSKEGNWWMAKLDFSATEFPVAYKYGVYNTKEKKFLRFEEGNNRVLYNEAGKKKLIIQNDGFIQLPNNTWRGAGVSIPVFSLRSKDSFGVGEFTDIKLLVDWAVKTGLKLIQLLPVNDTIATQSWVDSYPYAAISAFALHPLYINLHKVAGKEFAGQLTSLKRKQKQLNDLPVVDYEKVIRYKLSVLKELFLVMGEECLSSDNYKEFWKENRHWLQPYAAFCFFRDKYNSSHFENWKTNSIYKKDEIEKLFDSKAATKPDLAFYCFVQYHLHLQLKDAAEYAHKKGVVVKGDIPIGIYRYGCDAWVAPELYNMNWQAGAPPDDFTAIGQNWGFPTYNWKKMHEDGFDWWKQRFRQMSNYFDAFRIDHILGFFRIWSIPEHAVQGIMGRFVPCLPVYISEFGENGIWFDHKRYCKPFLIDEVLDEIFGDLSTGVKEEFLNTDETGGYTLKPGFETQVQVENYFANLESTEQNEKIKLGLYACIANVILFQDTSSLGEQYHFRISMDKTLSFKYLIPYVQEKLKSLYVDYFFRRQDDFWYKEAMHKLPQLKAATNMLVCGEDLGMVPHCVPDVMQQLGILSLEIQRMPKDPAREFFHPDDAPYFSVITPSTHDMSTIRGWWEENRERTQSFYNHVMGQWGDAPQYCESWINRAIVIQHLYSPAMWSIFQLQDLMGMNDTLRRENPQEERINNPANPKNYWQYRMHITLEDLLKQKDFNDELLEYVKNSGRG